MMQFLVTSLAAQTVNQFDAYFEFRNISAEQTLLVNNVFFVSTQYPNLFHHDPVENRVSFCLSDDAETLSSFIEAYESNALLSTSAIDCACGMFDFNTNSITWFEEDTGRHPIWFATKAKENRIEFAKSNEVSFILSDDLIVVDNIGSHSVSSFPPGNVMSLSLTSFGLINLQEKHSLRKAPMSLQTPLSIEDAETAVKLTLEPYLKQPEQYTFVIEYDPQYYSSRLLLCILFKMNLPVRVVRTRPTYFEFDKGAFGYDSFFRQLLDFMPPLSVQIANHLADTTHQQLSLQRRHACKPIDLYQTGKADLVLLSHLIVTDSHPIEIFYQNVLCAAYETTLLFPFRHSSFSNKLPSLRIGDFNVFVEKQFLADDSCPAIENDEVRIVSLEIVDDDDYEDNEAAEFHKGSWIHRMLENPTKSIDELLEKHESHDAYYRKKNKIAF